MGSSSERKATNRVVSDEALDILFRKARSYSKWLDKPVSDDTLRTLYDLMKWGPTSANLCPARVIFVRTLEAKQRLLPCVTPGNLEKTRTAPVTAIIGFDREFYTQAPKLRPQRPEIRDTFGALPPAVIEAHAFRNGTLQGAYFILAARALGLDCGPMSGFDNAKVDAEFLVARNVPGVPGGAGWGSVTSNFLCNLGYGDHSAKLLPRNPRLDFDDACQLI